MAVTKGNSEDRPVVGPGLFEDDLRPNIGELADPDEGPAVGLGGKTLLVTGEVEQDAGDHGESTGDVHPNVGEVEVGDAALARVQAGIRRSEANRENLIEGEELTTPEDVEEARREDSGNEPTVSEPDEDADNR